MRLCYVASGLHYTPSAGPSGHVVSLAEALSRKSGMEITLAFHGYTETPVVPVELLDLYGGGRLSERPSQRPDDIAVSGLNPLAYLACVRRCRAFARAHSGKFDVVTERMWRAGGFVGSGLQKGGAVYLLEENGPPGLPRGGSAASLPLRWVLHFLSEAYARRAYSQPRFIVVQTEELGRFLHSRFSVDPGRVRVVPNGVDTGLFRPMERDVCRRRLGLDEKAFILLFVGSLDVYHDLRPCMEALAALNDKTMQLHVVGGGVLRGLMESEAAELVPDRCVFHYPVPHGRVPLWINAADICVAPYRKEAFGSERFYFSPLKVLEYMACGKPVISMPHGEIKGLLDSEYLISNTARGWKERLAVLPDRKALAAAGEANARRAGFRSWDKAADRYMEVIREAMT